MADAMTEGLSGPRPGRPVGEDLRRRAVAAVVERGMSFEAAARKFEVGTTSVFRWVRHFREQGDFKPGKAPGRPSRIEAERERILRLLEKRPELSGRALRDALAKEGVDLSAITVQRFLKRHGLRREERLARGRKPPRAGGA